jgi:hypothetical protein
MGLELGALKKWLAKNADKLKEGAKTAGDSARSGYKKASGAARGAAGDAKRKAEDWLGRDYDTHFGGPDVGALVAPKMSRNGKKTLAALAGAGALGAGGAGYAMSGDGDEDDKPRKKKRPY